MNMDQFLDDLQSLITEYKTTQKRGKTIKQIGDLLGDRAKKLSPIKLPQHPAHYKLIVRSIANQLELLVDHKKELEDLCKHVDGCYSCPLGSLVDHNICIRSILKYEHNTVEELYDKCKKIAGRI